MPFTWRTFRVWTGQLMEWRIRDRRPPALRNATVKMQGDFEHIGKVCLESKTPEEAEHNRKLFARLCSLELEAKRKASGGN